MTSSRSSIGGVWRGNFLRSFAQRQPKIIFQTERAECGLACIAMVANHHGYDIDLLSLRQRHANSIRGADLNDLVNIAGRLNMSSRALKAEIDELADVQLPCVLHWGMDHFVVLSQIKKQHYVILDPAAGMRTLNATQFGRHFSGILLELIPSASFHPAQLRRRLKITDLWTRIEGMWMSLAPIVLLSLLVQILTVVSPLYMQMVVDVVLTDGQSDLLTPIAVGFALLMLTQALLGLLRSYAILHLSNRLNVQMGANLFHHLVRLPLSYFLKRHLGDVLSRFQSIHRVRQLMTNGIVSAWLDGIMALVTLAAMLYYSVELTVLVLVAVGLYALSRVLSFHRMRTLRQEQLIAGANENSHFMETMRAMQTLKIFQKESERQGQWLNRLTDVINRDTQIAKWEAAFSAINSILFGLENIVVIYACVLLVQKQHLSLGMVFAFLSFKVSFTRSISSLITQAVDFILLDVHLERLSDIAFSGRELDTAELGPRERAAGNDGGPGRLQGRIDVRNLGFRFEGSRQFAFRNVSFSIESGETAAIVGPSGCGKTTLMKCLMGLIEPSEGLILVDGTPVTHVANYRAQIAAVMQDDQLISGTIKDNIAFFEEVASFDRVVECAKSACVHNEIMSMPMQYNTLVGDLGASLSGGQKQRLLLARALYRCPRILFMDEATSHLDVDSEASVNAQINRLSITRVLIAHRPETIRCAGKRIHMADRGESVDLKSRLLWREINA